MFIFIILFLIIAALVYSHFYNQIKSWENFILSNGYLRQKHLDKDIMKKFDTILNILQYKKVYNKEEINNCKIWIVQAKIDYDSPDFTYIILNFKDNLFPKFWLSNIGRSVYKLPRFWKFLYKKSIKQSSFIKKDLNLIENSNPQNQIQNFAVFSESQEKYSHFFTENLCNLLNDWPQKYINQIFIKDNLIIIYPSISKKSENWKNHLKSIKNLIRYFT